MDEPESALAGLERAAYDAIAELARTADPAAFEALLRLSDHLGQSLGASARHLAATNSGARVADVAGTTRQAAWARWKG